MRWNNIARLLKAALGIGVLLFGTLVMTGTTAEAQRGHSGGGGHSGVSGQRGGGGHFGGGGQRGGGFHYGGGVHRGGHWSGGRWYGGYRYGFYFGGYPYYRYWYYGDPYYGSYYGSLYYGDPIAYQREKGYRDGFSHGRSDAKHRNLEDPYRHDHYRKSSSITYREAFLQGYNDGFYTGG